ncbi:ScbR family autoregulator-binding transcription factor [Streptomyces sp. SID1328]|uniref:ScbR family autoregulator-binding transcription factor n=1 Tax=Streptomyces sp. SID1328 TaxID=2690250 RepID=UPI0031F84D37
MRRQQERAVKMRASIVRAAAEEFDQHGYAATSTANIVRRAGCTMGALYFHFPAKEHLARAVMAEQAADLPAVPGPVGLQRLINLTLVLARELQGNVTFRAGVQLSVEQSAFGLQDDAPYLLWIERFEDELIAAQALGQLRDGVVPARFARTLVGAFSGVQLLSRISAQHQDLEERIVDLWSCLLPAVAAPDFDLSPPLDEGDA